MTSTTRAQTSGPVDGKLLFASHCGACHGSDGAGGERAPSIATRREVIARTNADLTRTVRGGIAGTGMPPFSYLGDDRIDAIVHYLRKLQGVDQIAKSTGDAKRGESLFFGKGECSQCHLADGRGGYMAQDLTGYGVGRSLDAVRSAILDPDANLAAASQTVTLVTAKSERLQGVIRARDNFSLTLQTDDGKFHTLQRTGIERIEPSGHSSMPRDYAQRLDDTEINDLVSYLLRPLPGQDVQGKDKDDE